MFCEAEEMEREMWQSAGALEPASKHPLALGPPESLVAELCSIDLVPVQQLTARLEV